MLLKSARGWSQVREFPRISAIVGAAKTFKTSFAGISGFFLDVGMRVLYPTALEFELPSVFLVVFSRQDGA